MRTKRGGEAIKKDEDGSFLFVGRWIVAPFLIIVAIAYGVALIGTFGRWLGVL